MISSTAAPTASMPHHADGASSSQEAPIAQAGPTTTDHPLGARRSEDEASLPPQVAMPPRSPAWPLPQATPDMRSPAPLLPGLVPMTPADCSWMGGVAAGVASGLKGAAGMAHQGMVGAQALATAAVRNLWSLSDLRTMLQPSADDPQFLRMLRGRDPEVNSEYTFAQCRNQLQDLRRLVEAGQGIEPRFQETLLKDIKTIEQALNPLENGTSAAGRAVKALLNMVNLWPVLVPSKLLADQAKTFAYTVAAASKAVVGVAGATLRPTADGLPFPLGGGELGRHADEVHFYPALLNAIFLSIEMSKKYGSPSVRQQAEAVEHNKLAHAGFAVAAGMALIAPFVWTSVKSGANKVVEAGIRTAALGMERAGFTERADTMRREISPGMVGQEVMTELSRIWEQLETGRLALQNARLDFTDPASGKELTRTLNSQCTHLLESIALCTERLDKAFGISAAQEAAGAVVPRAPSSNNDFASKVALTIFATAITASTVYLIQPDPIGTVDLAADSAVVTAVMLQSAMNKQATRQDAMERFKGMAATSMVMALALSADKISKEFTPRGLVEADSSAPYYASLVMTMMAMTMPGPIARGAELALNWSGSQLATAGGKIAGLFKGPGGQPLATAAPASPEELVQRMAELSAYARTLPPEQLLQYEQAVADSVHERLEGAAARSAGHSQRSQSSVVIEEIVEGRPTPTA